MSALLTRAKKLEKLVQVSNMEYRLIVVNSPDEETEHLKAMDCANPNLHLCVLRLYDANPN